MRCDFVDLYHSLFGSKIPNCLAKNEMPLISGLPKIPKISKITDNKRSGSPFDNGLPPKPNNDELNDTPVTIKREPDTNNKSFEVNEDPVAPIKVS